MKEKALKRLSRAELLELLLRQTQETERLQEKLAEAEALLAQRHLKVQEAGNLANAVLAVNNVVEAAQAAAQQYLDNIIAMEAQTKARCEQLLREAEESRIHTLEVAQTATRESDGQLLAELHNILDKEARNESEPKDQQQTGE